MTGLETGLLAGAVLLGALTVSGVALVAGLVAGEAATRRLDAARGSQVVIAVALAGGVATVVRGLAELGAAG